MQLSHEMVIESQSIRTKLVSDQTDVQSLANLNKAKALVMAVWNSTSLATTEQLANYYEVEPKTIVKLQDRHRTEFGSEVKNLVGKELQKVRDILSLSSFTPQALVFTARGALRVGLLLTQSEVAKSVRDVVLNVVESVPQIALESFRVLDRDCSYKNKEFNKQFLLNPARPTVDDKNYIVQQFLNEAWHEKQDQLRIIFETIYKVGVENKRAFTFKQLRKVLAFSNLYKEEPLFVVDCIELMIERNIVIGILHDNYDEMVVELSHFIVNFDKGCINRLIECQSWLKEEHLTGFLRPKLDPWRSKGSDLQPYMDNKLKKEFHQIPLGASLTQITHNGERLVVYASKTLVDD